MTIEAKLNDDDAAREADDANRTYDEAVGDGSIVRKEPKDEPHVSESNSSNYGGSATVGEQEKRS